MATLKQAQDLIDQFVERIDDIIKDGKSQGGTLTRAEAITDSDIAEMVEEMSDQLSEDDAAEAERYLRLKVAA